MVNPIWYDPNVWVWLFALFLLVVPNWGSMKVFDGAGNMSEDEYTAALVDIKENRAGGGLIVRSTWVLVVLQILRNLALWLAWFFYLCQGANIDCTDPDNLTTFGTYYIVLNSLIFAGVVFHVASENWFWQLGWFASSFAQRIIEALLFIAALVVSIIELVALPSSSECPEGTTVSSTGQEWFLLIVLVVIVLHTLFILLPRNWVFWSWDSARQGGYTTLGGDATANRLVPSAGKAQAAQHMRAAAAIWQQQSQQFAK